MQEINNQEANLQEDFTQEVPEINELLEKTLIFALDEASQKLTSGQDFIPFTAIVVDDKVIVESHPAQSTQASFESASSTVLGTANSRAYAFCYDGFIEEDGEEKDAIIAEGAMPDNNKGVAICYTYSSTDNNIVVDSQASYLGEVPSFMKPVPVSSAGCCGGGSSKHCGSHASHAGGSLAADGGVGERAHSGSCCCSSSMSFLDDLLLDK